LEPVSVLIVDDSALMRNLIRRMLDADEEIQVVGTAMNGQFALRKTVALNPDIIVLDLEMPELDGIGFLEKRKENNWNVPVVILSAVAKKGAEVTMKALTLGASDFVTKPSGGTPESNRETAAQLVSMVKGYGGTYQRSKEQTIYQKDITKPVPATPDMKRFTPSPVKPQEKQRISDWPEIKPMRQPAAPEIIAIGISTGGPNALRKVFAEISGNLKVPIVVVQHMPAGFTREFANSLDKICPLDVKEAEDGDIIKPGRILIAPGDKHIKVEKKSLAAIAHVVDGENVNGHKPSAGVLFDSISREYGNAALAIIMTGMGRDGSREIGNVYKEGSVTLAQDEESSVVFGMPRVAVEHDYITRIVSLNDMAGTINRLAGAS